MLLTSAHVHVLYWLVFVKYVSFSSVCTLGSRDLPDSDSGSFQPSLQGLASSQTLKGWLLVNSLSMCTGKGGKTCHMPHVISYFVYLNTFNLYCGCRI